MKGNVQMLQGLIVEKQRHAQCNFTCGAAQRLCISQTSWTSWIFDEALLVCWWIINIFTTGVDGGGAGMQVYLQNLWWGENLGKIL